MAEKRVSNSEDKIPLRDRPIDEVAAVLQDILGQQITAYAVYIRDPREIGRIARGTAVDKEVEPVLRDLAQVTEAVTSVGTPEITRAIMIGANPLLEDQAPIELFHRGEYYPVLNAGSRLAAGQGS